MRLFGATLLLQLGAEGATDPLGGWGVFVQYGVVGAVALAFITNKFHSHGEFTAVVADRDLARTETRQALADNAALRQKMEEQVVPALVRATEALASVEKGRRTSQLR